MSSPTATTPGLPDMRHIVGDWDGTDAQRREQALVAYNDLRDRIRKVTAELLRERERWANSTIDGAVARAVAYQNAAGQLIRALDASDRLIPPATAGLPGSLDAAADHERAAFLVEAAGR